MNKQRQVVLVPFSSTRLIQLPCLSLLPVDWTREASVNNIDIVSSSNDRKDRIEKRDHETELLL